MHIPATMLKGAICPVTLAVAAGGLAIAVKFAMKIKEKVSVAKFAAVTALVFALQMLNFPIQNGTSGHLLGALLAVSLLEIPFAILSISLVLAIQAVFFADGGLNALGANIINMAFIGAGACGLFKTFLSEKIGSKAALPVACWLSVMGAALACSLEVAFCGAVELSKVIPAMLGVHAIIGIGEALITALVLGILTVYAAHWQKNEKAYTVCSFVLATIAVLASPLASSFPDGLEYVAGQLSFQEFGALNFNSLFPDYQVTAIANASLSTVAAGMVGLALIIAVAYISAGIAKAKA